MLPSGLQKARADWLIVSALTNTVKSGQQITPGELMIRNNYPSVIYLHPDMQFLQV